MKHIHSAKNPQVKHWKKLLTKKERDKSGTYIVEGYHLVEEALKADKVEELIVGEQAELPQKLNYGDVRVTTVTAEIIKELSDTEAPQGIFAICIQDKVQVSDIIGKTFLLIDSVQDPGNLGTMIRTADAAGIDAVIVGNGSVDTYNQKVLRSAQGSHFHLPVLRGDLREWVDKFRLEEIPLYGTALENGQVYTEVEPTDRFALVVGNEGSGVSKDILTETNQNLYIPIFGKSESLNVAVATGILLYYLRG